MKTKLYKAVLLAALGLGGITAAQAQDALLGFNSAPGTGSGNDYVIDLGSGSQFNNQAILNFSFSSTTFSNAFSSDSLYLNNVAAGFVSGGTGSVLLQSYAGGTPAASQPSGTPSKTQYNSSVAAASGILLGVNASASGSTASGSAWSFNIAASPNNNGLLGASALAGNTGNPMGTLSSGVITLPIYESTALNFGNRNETTTAWQEIGTLTVDANAGTALFIGSVPEPSTYSLLGGAGLLLISLRNKFSRKQA